MARWAPFLNALLFTLVATLSVSRLLMHTALYPYLPYINLVLIAVIVLFLYRRMKITIERYYAAASRKRRSGS